MKERPILFSGPMVRAILDGKKTQTRRVVKMLPRWTAQGLTHADLVVSGWWESTDGWQYGDEIVQCPFGKPGDRLWVRYEHYRFGHWEPIPGVKTKKGRMKWRFVPDSDEVLYEAPESFRKGRHHKDSATKAWHKRLARFMPRWASRLTLEITNVRVERLQSISEADAKAEGCPDHRISARTPWMQLNWYRETWDSINSKRDGGKYAWDKNPWVWVIDFKKVSA